MMASELSLWRPFRELTTLREEMDRLWNRFFGEREALESFRGEWVPSFDVSETKDNVVVKAEVPGMDPQEIDISYTNGILTVRGERRQEKEEKDENYHMVVRKYGSFSRSVRLPHEIKSDKIKANDKDGVLKIILPKSEEAKKKAIKIRVEQEKTFPLPKFLKSFLLSNFFWKHRFISKGGLAIWIYYPRKN